MASKWFCKISGENIGPMSSRELRAMAKAGQLTPQHLVRRGKEGKWVPAIRVDGLFGSESESPEEDSSERQILNVTPGDDSHRTAPSNRKEQAARRSAGAKNRTPQPKRSRRPIPTNSQRQAPAQSAPAADPFGIVTDDSTPSARVGGRSSGGGTGGTGKKKQSNMIIFGSLGALGLAAVIAIIVMVSQGKDDAKPQAGKAGIPSNSNSVDPEGEGIEDLEGNSEKPDEEPTEVAAAGGDSSKPGNGQAGTEKSAGGVDGKYKDASSAEGYRIGDYEVKVLSAQTGMPSFTKRPANPKDEYFIVTIKVYNRHEGKRMPYASWTGSKSRSTPKLVDNWDDAYSLEKGYTVKGYRVSNIIDADESVKEILVFRDPKRVDKIQYLLLDLPGAAVKAKEDIYFKIPADMIGEAEPPEEDADEPLETTPSRRRSRDTADAANDPATSEVDPITAASTAPLDSEQGDEVEVIHKPAPNPNSSGDKYLDQLSKEHGF